MRRDLILGFPLVQAEPTLQFNGFGINNLTSEQQSPG